MKQLSKVEVRTGIRSVDGRHEYDTPGRKIGNRYDRMVRDFENTKRVALEAATASQPKPSLMPKYDEWAAQVRKLHAAGELPDAASPVKPSPKYQVMQV